MEGLAGTQGIEEPYIQILTRLYNQQRATTHTDVESKLFHLELGTKQEDLFNSHPLLYIITSLSEK